MPRITMPIRSAHPDGSICTHKLTTVGKATEPGCPGRGHFTATCSVCAEVVTASLKTNLRAAVDRHLARHRRQLPACVGGRPVTDLRLPA